MSQSVERTDRYESPILHYGFYAVLFATALVTLFYHTLAHSAHTPSGSCRDVSVSISDTGFLPSRVQAKGCTKLIFRNTGKQLHQPAIGEHIHHAGAYTNQEKLLKPDDTNNYTISQAGDYTFHDHLFENLTGKLQIKP